MYAYTAPMWLAFLILIISIFIVSGVHLVSLSLLANIFAELIKRLKPVRFSRCQRHLRLQEIGRWSQHLEGTFKRQCSPDPGWREPHDARRGTSCLSLSCIRNTGACRERRHPRLAQPRIWLSPIFVPAGGDFHRHGGRLASPPQHHIFAAVPATVREFIACAAACVVTGTAKWRASGGLTEWTITRSKCSSKTSPICLDKTINLEYHMPAA